MSCSRKSINSQSEHLDEFSDNNDFDESKISEQSIQSIHEHIDTIYHSFTETSSCQLSPTIVNERLEQLAVKHNIERDLIKYLYLLVSYEIIFIFDDSGSMRTVLDNNNLSRWDELKQFIKTILEILLIFHSDGINIYFLNQPSVHNINNTKIIDEIFSTPPRGYTSLAPVLEHICQSLSIQKNNNKKFIFFIATDGEPTDDKGNINTKYLENLINEKFQLEYIYLTFLICTDDQSSVNYLNQWSKKFNNIYVIQNFEKEKEKIRINKGKNYRFTKEDYFVKALIDATRESTNYFP